MLHWESLLNMKEKNYNRATAQYADFTFNIKETAANMAFNTSERFVQPLMPTTCWADQSKDYN